MPGSGDVETASNTAASHQFPKTAPNDTLNPLQPPKLHPNIAAMREHGLGKMVFGMSIFSLVGTFFQKPTELGVELPIIQILLAMGCVAIWNGIMLEKTYPKVASLSEQVGISLVLLAFTVLLASNIPEGFTWFPVLCFGLFILPFIMAAVSQRCTTLLTKR